MATVRYCVRIKLIIKTKPKKQFDYVINLLPNEYLMKKVRKHVFYIISKTPTSEFNYNGRT